MTEQSIVQEPQEQKKGIWVQLLPGLLVSVIIIVLLLKNIDIEEAVEAIKQANYRWMPLVLLGFFGTLFARTIAWRAILQNEITWKRTFWTLTEGYFLNNILPFRLGELGRVLILNTTEGLSGWRVLSSIMVERIFDVAFMAGLLLATAPFAVGMENAPQAAIIAAGLVVAGFIILFWSANFPQQVLGIFSWFTNPFPKIKEFGYSKLESLLEGLNILADWRRFFFVAFWMLITWVFNVGWYFMLLLAFVPEATPLMAGFTVGMASLGVAVPSVPGYTGPFHLAVIGGLAVFGIGRSVAAGFAVLAHLIYMGLIAILGGIAISRDGLSLFGLFGRLRNKPDTLSEK